MMTKRKCFIHGQYEGETCPQCENAALPPVRSEPLLADVQKLFRLFDRKSCVEAENAKTLCGHECYERAMRCNIESQVYAWAALAVKTVLGKHEANEKVEAPK